MKTGYVKSYGDRLTERAEKVERWNAAIDTIQEVCHGFGAAIFGIGLMYTVAVGLVLLIGEDVTTGYMIGSLAADAVGALLLAM